MAVFTRENKHLYCLRNKHGFWLTTLATNRQECWHRGCVFGTKEEIKREGYTCVPVVITEIK